LQTGKKSETAEEQEKGNAISTTENCEGITRGPNKDVTMRVFPKRDIKKKKPVFFLGKKEGGARGRKREFADQPKKKRKKIKPQKPKLSHLVKLKGKDKRIEDLFWKGHSQARDKKKEHLVSTKVAENSNGNHAGKTPWGIAPQRGGRL